MTNRAAPRLPRRVRTLAVLSPWVRALVRREPLFRSESDADFALARTLYAHGIRDAGEIASALYASRADAGVEPDPDPEYYARTARRVIAWCLERPWTWAHGRGAA